MHGSNFAGDPPDAGPVFARAGLTASAEPARLPVMSAEAQFEQMRAVNGALDFLESLIAFYAETIGRDETGGARPIASERPGVSLN